MVIDSTTGWITGVPTTVETKVEANDKDVVSPEPKLHHEHVQTLREAEFLTPVLIN